jgi:DeoR family deoxyribose operon repressor
VDRRQERQAQIVHKLKIFRASTIRELARELAVSEMTIRRDLHELSRSQPLKVFHGGVILNEDSETSGQEPLYSLVTEETLKTEEKRRIGQLAASLIEPNDIIIVDSGSTTEYLSKAIPMGFPITVLCYSLNNLVEICRKQVSRVVSAGGTYYENTMSFESPQGVELIRSSRANKAFFAARGVDERLGITTANHYEVDLKKAALASSLTRILLIDSSKFGNVGAAYYASLEDFEAIVTDKGIPKEYSRMITERGITLYLA